MSRFVMIVFLLCLTTMTGYSDVLSEETPPADPGSITLLAKHRLYPDFSEQHTVAMNQRFAISDEGYEAVITRYLPDFAIQITDEGKKIFSKSTEANNPAFWIVVYKDSAAVDSVWAFSVRGAPHFSRNSFIYFEILEFDSGDTSGETEEGQ